MNTQETKTLNISQSSVSAFLTCLKALGGATVATLSSFSLFLASAQAASFVTTFETEEGNVTLEWSGEDEDDNGFIVADELSGPISLNWVDGVDYDLGDPMDMDFLKFKFDMDEGEIDIEPGSLNFELGYNPFTDPYLRPLLSVDNCRLSV